MLLIDFGADVNAKNVQGITLLHILLEAEFVPDVVNAGGDLEARDMQGYTPIIAAIDRTGNLGIVEALLAGGADPNARNDEGKAALDVARSLDVDEGIIGRLLRSLIQPDTVSVFCTKVSIGSHYHPKTHRSAAPT